LAPSNVSDRRWQVVRFLDQEAHTQHGGEFAHCGERALLVFRQLPTGAADPQEVEVGSEPLGGAPGAADETLGTRSPTAWRASAAIVSLRVPTKSTVVKVRL
jgi:hypothetical protein